MYVTPERTKRVSPELHFLGTIAAITVSAEQGIRHTISEIDYKPSLLGEEILLD